MGPTRAAQRFKARNPDCKYFVVTLYGSLALTGRGHLTDRAIINTLMPAETKIIWDYVKVWERHTNAMKFQALDGPDGKVIDEYMAYSVGGGAILMILLVVVLQTLLKVRCTKSIRFTLCVRFLSGPRRRVSLCGSSSMNTKVKRLTTSFAMCGRP